MIKVTVKNNVIFPEFTLQEDLESMAQDIIIKDLEKHIDIRASIDQGALPPNEPETKKRKGHDHQLFETGELRKSFYYRNEGEKKVIVSILDGRKQIGQYLQDGIMAKGRLKQYIFFGISQFAEKECARYMIKRIQELLNGKSAKR